LPNYRRYFVPGGTYFFTLVTHERRPILTTELGRSCLRSALEHVQQRYPFELFAIVLLPDHLHCVVMLPSDDARYSLRWQRIKETFTESYLANGGTEGHVSLSRQKQGERGIWQRRFWEHTIRDEDDLSRCVDYIHWNPAKHGLVSAVRDYEWSSFMRFVSTGDYQIDWGSAGPASDLAGAEWD